jgi:hypothetical protein
MRTWAFVGVVVVAVGLVGCGGGGIRFGQSGGGGIIPDGEKGSLGSIGTSSDTNIRQLLSGDVWRYNVNGTAQDVSGGAEIVVGGTFTTVLSSLQIDFPADYIVVGKARVLLETGDVRGAGFNLNIAERRFFTQGDDRAIIGYGWYNWQAFDPSKPELHHWADRAFTVAASPMDVGTSWETQVLETVTDASGTSTINKPFDEHWVAVAEETLTLPAGRCIALRVTGNGRFGGLTAENIDEWWAPQVGAPVQVVMTSTVTQTIVDPNTGAETKTDWILRLTYQLAWTNVARTGP